MKLGLRKIADNLFPIKTYNFWRLRRLTVKVKTIKTTSLNKWNAAIVAPYVLLFVTNWPILSAAEGEINENSHHPLALTMSYLGVKIFSFSQNQGTIQPLAGQNAHKLSKRVVKLLIRWETDPSYREMLQTVLS